MSQSNPVRRFTFAELFPVMDVETALKAALPVNFPPSTTIAAGTLLLPAVATATSAVQTVTAPGSLTYTLSGVNPLTVVPFTTTALAFGANDAAVQAALNTAIAASGPGSVTVASLAVTFAGALAGIPVPLMTIASAGSGSPAVANTTPGVSSGTATVYPGSSGAVAYISRYSIITDNTGLITDGAQTGVFENGAIDITRSVFTRGFFDASKLSILDANAVTKLGARFITGSLTAGPGSTPAGTIYIP